MNKHIEDWLSYLDELTSWVDKGLMVLNEPEPEYQPVLLDLFSINHILEIRDEVIDNEALFTLTSSTFYCDTSRQAFEHEVVKMIEKYCNEQEKMGWEWAREEGDLKVMCTILYACMKADDLQPFHERVMYQVSKGVPCDEPQEDDSFELLDDWGIDAPTPYDP
jgi:hypothetical protein